MKVSFTVTHSSLLHCGGRFCFAALEIRAADRQIYFFSRPSKLSIAPGVGIYNSIAKPRVLTASEGEEIIDGELFEAIKETILVCQICTQINVCPRSSADCLHRFCN